MDAGVERQCFPVQAFPFAAPCAFIICCRLPLSLMVLEGHISWPGPFAGVEIYAYTHTHTHVNSTVANSFTVHYHLFLLHL